MVGVSQLFGYGLRAAPAAWQDELSRRATGRRVLLRGPVVSVWWCCFAWWRSRALRRTPDLDEPEGRALSRPGVGRRNRASTGLVSVLRPAASADQERPRALVSEVRPGAERTRREVHPEGVHVTGLPGAGLRPCARGPLGPGSTPVGAGKTRQGRCAVLRTACGPLDWHEGGRVQLGGGEPSRRAGYGAGGKNAPRPRTPQGSDGDEERGMMRRRDHHQRGALPLIS